MSVFLQSFRQLGQFPGSGRPSATPDVRELIIGRYPFIASYRLIHGRIQILRVLHQPSDRSSQR
ncbi:type II toxin-antitoxin system RelE/ParE family toxin [Pseudomonas fluorescens]|uniref:type II toxin-antitoxin system RelE/ParE family toxin n=1 Tax=Pseudomonas fluorescens TaxID=294 RepID=UPI003523B73A